jgi:hypothetical protein
MNARTPKNQKREREYKKVKADASFASRVVENLPN